MEFSGDVDIVVPWVDGSNLAWQDQCKKYDKKIIDADLNGPERFRSDAMLLVQWLKGVNKYAKWVNRIFIVIDRSYIETLPKELGENVSIVCHDEFIPEEYLPTFNSNVIELFIDRIIEVAEHFVLFNDDCYVVKEIKKSDFFNHKGVPVDSDVARPLNTAIDYSHVLLNDLIVINQNLSFREYKRSLMKKMMFRFDLTATKSLLLVILIGTFFGWQDEHMPIPYRKADYRTVFEKCGKIRLAQAQRKFRTRQDISHLLIRFWRLATGEYVARKAHTLGVFMEIEPSLEQVALKKVLSESAKIVCVNDHEMSEEQETLAYEGLKKTLDVYYEGNLG